MRLIISKVGTLILVFSMLVGVYIDAHAQRYSEWSTPVNLGSVINTSGFDGCPSLTRDGLNLLFMSNFGSTAQDLYVSHRESTDPSSPVVDTSAPSPSSASSRSTATFGNALTL